MRPSILTTTSKRSFFIQRLSSTATNLKAVSCRTPAAHTMITLYDLCSVNAGTTWSPNVWKSRLALNFKSLPYKSEWVEFSDIASAMQKLGAKPTGRKKDGAEIYTVPVIYDEKTERYISDSYAIAEYLDDTYPDTPQLFPDGKMGDIAEFEKQIHAKLVAPLVPLVMLPTHQKLSARSQKFFRLTRERMFRKKLEEISPAGLARDVMFEKLKEGLKEIGAIYDQKSGANKPYFLGDNLSYADILLLSWLLWPKYVFEPEEWEKIAGYQEGRWGKLVDSLKNLQKIQ